LILVSGPEEEQIWPPMTQIDADKTGNREVGLQLTTGGTNNGSEALSGR